MARLVGLLVLAGLAVLSSWWGVGDLLSLRRAAASADWPTATGEVQSRGAHARVIEMADSDRNAHCFEPCVVYAYQVEGRDYTGTRVMFQPSNQLGDSHCHPSDHIFEYRERRCLCRRGSAWQIAARYKVGEKVAVLYDPDEPAQACLEPYTGDYSLGWGVTKLLARLALLAALGLVILRVPRRSSVA